jgi:hypothetical protein
MLIVIVFGLKFFDPNVSSGVGRLQLAQVVGLAV